MDVSSQTYMYSVYGVPLHVPAMCVTILKHFSWTCNQTFSFLGLLVRNFGIPGITMKSWDNPWIFGVHVVGTGGMYLYMYVAVCCSTSFSFSSCSWSSIVSMGQCSPGTQGGLQG